jgi:hypothetical protein
MPNTSVPIISTVLFIGGMGLGTMACMATIQTVLSSIVNVRGFITVIGADAISDLVQV